MKKIGASILALLLVVSLTSCNQQENYMGELPDGISDFVRALDDDEAAVALTYMMPNAGNDQYSHYYTNDIEVMQGIWHHAAYEDWTYIGGSRNDFVANFILRLDPSTVHLYFSKDDTLLIKAHEFDRLFKVPKGTYQNLRKHLELLVAQRQDFDLTVLDALFSAETLDITLDDTRQTRVPAQDFGDMSRMVATKDWTFLTREHTDVIHINESCNVRVASPDSAWNLRFHHVTDYNNGKDLYVVSVWKDGDYYSYSLPAKQYTEVHKAANALFD